MGESRVNCIEKKIVYDVTVKGVYRGGRWSRALTYYYLIDPWMEFKEFDESGKKKRPLIIKCVAVGKQTIIL